MNNLDRIKSLLDSQEDLRKYLFIRGFLITEDGSVPADDYPFYGVWKKTYFHGFHFWSHPLTGIHFAEKKGVGAFLLGHAYNPFTMEIREENQLERLLDHFGQEDFYDYLDELTGIFVLGFIKNGDLIFFADPAGIQSACTGIVNDCFCLSSHSQLISDLYGLKQDAFVTRLVDYKWYPRVLGGYLPADMTPYSGLKRVVPNQHYTFCKEKCAICHTRFYPLKEITICNSEEEYAKVIAAGADILRKNMELVLQKWANPWQSLTGGIDSNTTFAAANGYYDKLHTFSYFSAEKESIDCEAAEKIAGHFKVPWVKYTIPESHEGLPQYEAKTAIIRHNNAYIAKEKENELRKRVYLEANCPAEVEIKSWVSETIRAYWYKYYGRKSFPKLSARLYRNFYKIFITNRKLAHEVDRLYKVYIDEYEYCRVPSQFSAADMNYTEIGWGSWGSLNISEMKFCFDITILYNNRKFFDLMFRVPLEKRISDQHHLNMKKLLNPELYNMNIRVVNMKETKFRSFALNCVFTMNTILPF